MGDFRDILELYGPVGIGVMVAIFILKEALVPWVRSMMDAATRRKNGKEKQPLDAVLFLEKYGDTERCLASIRESLQRIEGKIEDIDGTCSEIFNLHDVRDENGNPVWWTTAIRSYVQEIAVNIDKIVTGLEQVIRTNEEYSGLLHQLQESEAQRRISEAREQGRREGLRERK